MKLTLKSLLKNKTVLYVVLFFAITNLFGYLMTKNLDAVVFMLVVGIVTSSFSKNMIVILGASVVATGFAVGNGIIGSVVEGLSDKKKKHKHKNKKMKNQGDVKENLATLKPKNLVETESENDDFVGADEAEQKGASGGSQSNIDYASTLEKAYDNLDNLLSSDAINKMGEETERLGQKQKQLMKNIDRLEPMMEKASSILNKFDMNGVIGKMDSMMENLGKFNKKTE